MRQAPCGIHRAMEVRRLAWAGLEVSAAGQAAVVDLVEDFSRLHGSNPPGEEIPPSPSPETAVAGLLTHLHSDHADIDALGRALAPTAVVLRPERGYGGGAEVALIEKPESELEASGLASRVVKPWETVEVGPFSFTALPAADGFGDPQVSWCIAADGCRILHAGDTLFHGWWWLSALRQGPFDVAFLPVGGAVADLPPRQPPSPLPADMDPRQAAVAAKLLGARTVVPIHYGPLHEASNYVQASDPPTSLCAAAAELGVEARVLNPGERFSVEAQQMH
jgi:L-ascorbate metabolism protein UlaG (beta-lactamase superfamily)